MKTTDCRNIRREIDSTDLDQRLSSKSMEHVAACQSCREFLDQVSSLRRLVASLETVSAPADFDMRLRARLAGEKKPDSTWINFWRQAPGVPAIAFAFSLLLIVTAVVYLRPFGRQQVALKDAPVAPTTATTSVVTPNTAAPNSDSANETQASNSGTSGQNLLVTGSQRPASMAGSGRSGKAGGEVAAVTKGPGSTSREYSQLPAMIIKPTLEGNGTAEAPVVSLSAPVQPVVVSMRDNHGATRTISLPPVSFGSQRLIQPGYQPAPLISSAKGVW